MRCVEKISRETMSSVAANATASSLLAAKALTMLNEVFYTVQKDAIRLLLLAVCGVVMQKLATVLPNANNANNNNQNNIFGQHVTPAVVTGLIALGAGAYVLVTQAEETSSALDAEQSGTSSLASSAADLLQQCIAIVRRQKVVASLLTVLALVIGHRCRSVALAALRHLGILSRQAPAPPPPFWARKAFRVPAGIAAAVVVGQQALSSHRRRPPTAAPNPVRTLGTRLALIGEVVRIPIEQFVLRRRQVGRLARLLID